MLSLKVMRANVTEDYAASGAIPLLRHYQAEHYMCRPVLREQNYFGSESSHGRLLATCHVWMSFRKQKDTNSLS